MASSGIELRGVGYAVAGKAILMGIDLHLSEARIGIVGRNGSGKTSLMRVMAGLVAPSSGAVRVADAARTMRFAWLLLDRAGSEDLVRCQSRLGRITFEPQSDSMITIT